MTDYESDEAIPGSIPRSVTNQNQTMTNINCGCGDFGIEVSEHKPIYTFDAICPECGNHFGFDASNDVEEITFDK